MYFGGKNGAGVYQSIINYLPPHRVYIEAFLGSGAIMTYKKPAEINIGLEISQNVLDRFTYPSYCKVIPGDALTYLREFNATSDTLIYCDPPYPLSSRRSDRKVYEHEMSNEQHQELLHTLLQSKAMIAISTYKNPLYEKELSRWNLIKFQAKTQAGVATEYLYMNYPAPVALHDYSFLGEDYIQRQRIKRKIERHVSRLLELPPLERQAILNAIRNRV